MVRKIRSIKQARKAKWAAAESRTRGSAPRGQIRQGSCWALLGNRTASQKSAECRFEVHTLAQPPKASDSSCPLCASPSAEGRKDDKSQLMDRFSLVKCHAMAGHRASQSQRTRLKDLLHPWALAGLSGKPSSGPVFRQLVWRGSWRVSILVLNSFPSPAPNPWAWTLGRPPQ